MYSTRGSAAEILDTANMGTTHLLHAASQAGVQRVVYTSSTAAVGTSPKGQVKDEAAWNTDTSLPYTVAKTQSERLAWRLAEELGLDVRVINLDGQSGTLEAAFTYNAPTQAAPTLASITPSTGPSTGGTEVSVLGTGFDPAMRVYLGGQSITAISYQSAETFSLYDTSFSPWSRRTTNHKSRRSDHYLGASLYLYSNATHHH